MNDQNRDRFGPAKDLQKEISDTLEQPTLVGSAIHLMGGSGEPGSAAVDGLLDDVDAIAKSSALSGLDSALAALHGSSLEAHQATLDLVYRRFEDQIEIGPIDEIIANWTTE